MIHLIANSATTQYFYVTLDERKKDFTTQPDSYLITLKRIDTDIVFIANVISDNERYTKIQIQTDTADEANGDILLEQSGEYNYTIYGQTGTSNLDPTDAVIIGIFERGTLRATDNTNYYDEDTNTYGQAIVLNEAPMAGARINVQYTAYPNTITDNQELTLSGLPSSCEDVVRLGAMYRLLSTVDPGKVIATSVSADALDQPVSAGASTTAAKYLFQLYSVRLAEEVAKQQANFLNIIQYQR